MWMLERWHESRWYVKPVVYFMVNMIRGAMLSIYISMDILWHFLAVVCFFFAMQYLFKIEQYDSKCVV